MTVHGYSFDEERVDRELVDWVNSQPRVMPADGGAAFVNHPDDVVLHLDHTIGRGGAEYALARALAADAPWRAIVALPGEGPELGPFTTLADRTNVDMVFVGPAQVAGAASARSPLAVAKFILGVSRLAYAVHRSPEYRRAVLVHTNTSRAGIYGALACFGSGKPLVVHLRDMVDSDSLGALGEFVFRRFVLPSAAGVIANSQATLSSALPYVSRAAVCSVIPSAAGIGASRASATPAAPMAPAWAC